MLKLASDNQPTKILARSLMEGQLFIKKGEPLTADNVKMAVCHFGDNDDDVVFIYPFAASRLSVGYDELNNNYVNESTEVELVTFVGELERE
ncbi:hypothetical protein [Vibrio phage VCPH]|nr:hypothetical protein [Vibrio phage VCPH]